MIALQPRRYRVDLADLLSQCERNYWRLLSLLPQLRQHDQASVMVARGEGMVMLQAQVLERAPYTLVLDLRELSTAHGLLPSQVMRLRLYHDARIAEVLSYQSRRVRQVRHDYPNPGMHQPDEKVRLNAFLAEWLSHSLQQGLAAAPVLAR